MQSLLSLTHEKANLAIEKAFPSLSKEERKADVSQCMQEEFGHYQCNSALQLAKIVKQSPREIAQKIIDHFPKIDEKGKTLFSKIEQKGPGFINITFDPDFLSNHLDKAFREKHLGAKIPEKKQKIIVEFSSPNIAKELHVGHLRSTIIGDCIANLFEFLEQDVLRLNHVGDWGTHFGMLITYLKEKHPHVLEGKEEADLVSLTKWYKESKLAFDKDEEFKNRSRSEVVNLQSGEKKAYEAWQIICNISRKAFVEIYGLLDVQIHERGESFYNPMLPLIVEDLEKKGLIVVSDGAKCIYVEGFKNRDGNPLPIMIQKSDGGFNYDTTDMAAFKQRCQDEKADRIIVITDVGQSLHFQMVHKAAIKAKYVDPKKNKFDHVTFGLVLGSDRKKFKTRSGSVEKLIDLLTQAVSHAKKILAEKIEDLSEEELNKSAQILGIDAIKYADLSCHRQKDYQFSYDKMLKLEGNTAAFLLYSYVRILGINRKVQINIEDILQDCHIHLAHMSEISLGLHLCRFAEVIENFSNDLLPNRLADYLYELAEKFNAFFRDCRVQGSDEQNSRLILCEATARILKKGLDILGLKTLSRM